MDDQRAVARLAGDVAVDLDETVLVDSEFAQPRHRQDHRNAAGLPDHVDLFDDAVDDPAGGVGGREMVGARAGAEAAGETEASGAFDQFTRRVPAEVEALGGVHRLGDAHARRADPRPDVHRGVPVDVGRDRLRGAGRRDGMIDTGVRRLHHDMRRRVAESWKRRRGVDSVNAFPPRIVVERQWSAGKLELDPHPPLPTNRSMKPGPCSMTTVARNTVSTIVPRSMPPIHQIASGFFGVSSPRKDRRRSSRVKPR